MFLGPVSRLYMYHVQAMEECGHVERPQPAPSSMPPFPAGLNSSIPRPEDVLNLYRLAGAEDALQGLQQLTGFSGWDMGDGRRDARSAMPFPGGEKAGHERLRAILYVNKSVSNGSVPSSTAPAKAQQSISDIQVLKVLTLQEEPPGASTASAHSSSSAAGTCQDGDAQDTAGGATRQVASGCSDCLVSSSATRQEGQQALVHSFRDTRMLAGGVNNSAKLSAYLAAGCLSPRQVYWAARDAAEQYGSDTGHSWLIMHLSIRCAGNLSKISLS